MYSVALLLLIACALLGRCLRKREQTITWLKSYAVDMQVLAGELADDNRAKDKTIKDLAYKSESTGFMLAKVLDKVPDNDSLDFLEEFKKSRREKVDAIIKDIGPARSPGIPRPRMPEQGE